MHTLIVVFISIHGRAKLKGFSNMLKTKKVYTADHAERLMGDKSLGRFHYT